MYFFYTGATRWSNRGRLPSRLTVCKKKKPQKMTTSVESMNRWGICKSSIMGGVFWQPRSERDSRAEVYCVAFFLAKKMIALDFLTDSSFLGGLYRFFSRLFRWSSWIGPRHWAFFFKSKPDHRFGRKDFCLIEKKTALRSSLEIGSAIFDDWFSFLLEFFLVRPSFWSPPTSKKRGGTCLRVLFPFFSVFFIFFRWATRSSGWGGG